MLDALTLPSGYSFHSTKPTGFSDIQSYIVNTPRGRKVISKNTLSDLVKITWKSSVVDSAVQEKLDGAGLDTAHRSRSWKHPSDSGYTISRENTRNDSRMMIIVDNDLTSMENLIELIESAIEGFSGVEVSEYKQTADKLIVYVSSEVGWFRDCTDPEKLCGRFTLFS